MTIASTIPELTSRIIGYPCGFGAKRRGCAYGPLHLKEAGVAEWIKKAGAHVAWESLATAEENPSIVEPRDALPQVLHYCADHYAKVKKALEEKTFPLVLGGDHSMAIATWSAVTHVLGAAGCFGMIWIDAHMDSHTLSTTPSGTYHGMPLACLLGYGVEPLVTLGGNNPKLLPQHVCLVGVRSYEEGEAALLKKLGVRIFFIEEVQKRGLSAVLKEAIHIASHTTKAYGISLDLDALDPQEIPATGSPVAGGISAADLLHSLRGIARDSRLAAFEVAEYDPSRDKDAKTLTYLSTFLPALFSL